MPPNTQKIATAIRTLSEEGEANLSVREIATALGATQNKVKRHFDNSLRGVVDSLPHVKNERRIFTKDNIRRYIVFYVAVEYCECSHAKAIQYLQRLPLDEMWQQVAQSLDGFATFLHENRHALRDGEDPAATSTEIGDANG